MMKVISTIAGSHRFHIRFQRIEKIMIKKWNGFLKKYKISTMRKQISEKKKCYLDC